MKKPTKKTALKKRPPRILAQVETLWVIVLRADSDAAIEGVTDEWFLYGYRNLDRAKEAARDHLAQMVAEEERELSDEIQWAETTEDQAHPQYLGRPRADVEGCFEIYQIRVV